MTSFRAEHEKIAIRTFKEGLPTPLKFRIVNYEAKTLDEILKKTLELEPFVGISKPYSNKKFTENGTVLVLIVPVIFKAVATVYKNIISAPVGPVCR